MSTPTLKRHNHRVHPCKDAKKEELLAYLLEKNSDKKIIVATSTKSELTSTQDNVSILSDEELDANPDMKCELLISYDLPSKATKYMQRITHTSTYALILVNPSEERVIHPIETLIGRTIMQENVEGFSEERVEKTAQPKQDPADAREERKRKFTGEDAKSKKPREDRNKKQYDDKPRSDKKPWDKKEKKDNKFLGKDENGKAIFSGKSGERNHRYDGTPKGKPAKLTGRRVSIKALKKKD